MPTIRALARLRFRGSDSHLALIALLEDPAVPLSELRWLLEGDVPEAGGTAGAAAGAVGSADAGAAAGPSESRQPCRTRIFLGPAARGLLWDEAQWRRAVEAARGRGRGRAAREVRQWLEGWRRALQDRQG